MRKITSGERARQKGHANYYLKVEVMDSEGGYRDLTSLSGVNYVDQATWSASVDQPTMTGSVTLRREHKAFSLAPLVTGSALNKDSHGAYAPLLDVGRNIRITTAVTAHGTAPVSGDWKSAFLGYITDIDFGAEPITLTIADLGQRLVDSQIEALRDYGDSQGTYIGDVMQQILDDNEGAGIFTLFIPVPVASPDDPTALWNILPYEQSMTGVMDALTQVAIQIGWDVRYLYDNADVFQLTLWSPDRAKTTPDDTVGPSEYLDISRLAISNADVRNVVKISYVDRVSNLPSFQVASDSGSIAEFGRRFLHIGEEGSAVIGSAAEALTMATNAVSDLSDPLASQDVEMFYFWQVQISDLYKFSANGVHYDTDQQFAVVGFTHTLGINTHRTTLQVRGQVAGAYKNWLLTHGGEFAGTISNGPAPEIFPLVGELQAYQDTTRDGMAWVQVQFEPHTANILIYAIESLTTPAPIPELSSSRLSYSLTRLPGDKWSGDNIELIVPIATRPSYYRKIVGFGIGLDGTIGPTSVEEVQAADVGTGPSGPPTSFAVASAGTTNRVSWVNGDATAHTIVFRNGIGQVVLPGITGFIDTNLPSDFPCTYAICHFKNGQTSARIPDSGGGSGGGGGGGGGGGTVTPPAQNPTAPVWQSGYPQSYGPASVIYAWTTDASATEVAIELNPFTIAAEWEQLAVFTDVGHLPSGTLTDSKYPNGTLVQARIRSLVAGLEYYSAPVTVRYGIAPPVAPKFTNGTPENDGGSTYFEWTLSDSSATKFTITALGVGTIYTTTVSSQIQAGSNTYAHGLGGKQVYCTAYYPDGRSASSPTVRISTAV